MRRILFPAIVFVLAAAWPSAVSAHTGVAEPDVILHGVDAPVSAGDAVTLRGRIAGKDLCSTNQTVFLVWVREGRDRRIDEAHTGNDDRFSFSLRVFRDRVVYVRILERAHDQEGHEHSCLGDVSRRRHIDVA
jgi:hypothetical protein